MKIGAQAVTGAPSVFLWLVEYFLPRTLFEHPIHPDNLGGFTYGVWKLLPPIKNLDIMFLNLEIVLYRLDRQVGIKRLARKHVNAHVLLIRKCMNADVAFGNQHKT